MTWLCDASGHIADFFKATGEEVPGTAISTGLPLTDMAFIGTQMYGTTSDSIYQIDSTTGESTLIKQYAGSQDINALVGHNGNLYTATGNSHNIYQVSPTTGQAKLYAHIGFASAGDLAWSGNILYESVQLNNGNDGLYDVTDHRLVGAFRTRSGQHFNDLFALTDNQPTFGNPPYGMFAISGNDIYQINLANGVLTHLSNNAATGFGAAQGGAWMHVG